MVDMAHFAGLVAGKVLTGDYDPVPARAHRDDYNAQDLARAAWRTRSVRHATSPSSSTAAVRWFWAARYLTSWPPRPSRWPKRPAVLPGLCRSGRGQRTGSRRSAHGRWRASGHRRHGQPPRAHRCPPLRAQRTTSRSCASGGGHHVEPQRRSERHERCLVHERAAARHSRGHDARHGRRRDARDRRHPRLRSFAPLRPA